jgi:hypothetical protein
MANRKRSKGQTTIYKTYTENWRTGNTNSTKNRWWIRCFRRESSSCSTSGNRRVNLAINSVTGHEWGKDREVFMKGGTYPRSFVTQIFHSSQPSHGGDCKALEGMSSIKQIGWFSRFLVSSNPLSRKSWQEPCALEYRINWEYILHMQVLLECCYI